MARAKRPCSGRPGCPNLTDSGRCPMCAQPRQPWGGRGRASSFARGYDGEYVRNRARVLAEETHCGICGGPGLTNDEVDHKIPRARGGTNARENLQRAHKRCNASKLGRIATSAGAA